MAESLGSHDLEGWGVETPADGERDTRQGLEARGAILLSMVGEDWITIYHAAVLLPSSYQAGFFQMTAMRTQD